MLRIFLEIRSQNLAPEKKERMQKSLLSHVPSANTDKKTPKTLWKVADRSALSLIDFWEEEMST